MRICITSFGDNLESQVDPKFGRCAYFMIVDPQTLDFEAIDNSNIKLSGGAGIKAGQLISEKNVKALLTGDLGPNAFKTLKAANIDVIVGIKGTIIEAVEKYIKGDMESVNKASVESHFGFGGK